MMDSFVSDLRYGARMLWKSKGLTAIALVSLAIGIGANSAIFSAVNAILLRPRAVAAPEQLVEVYTGDRQNRYETTSYPSYLDFRANSQVFTGLAAYGLGQQFRISGTDDVEEVWGEAVSGNYFDVLGVRPHVGRAFLPEEDQVIGRNPVVVIGHALWQRRFNADPGLVGKTITVNNQALTVVGIAPPEWTGMLRGLSAEVFAPTMMMPLLEPTRGDRILTSRGNRWVGIVGRLKPGVTLEQARARFDVITQEMLAAHPQEWKRENGRDLAATVVPEHQTRVHPQMRPIVWAVVALVFVVVDLVLLIACMNLASMLFARAVARRSEIAVRLAIGAGRGRIVRQLLTESLLLAAIAGVAGIVLGLWGLTSILAFMPALPEGIRVALDIPLDWRVVTYTIVFSTATGLLFGLAPALHSARASLSSVLKDDTTALTSRHRTSRVRTGLVIGQVAFSLLLLIGAGLVLRSLEKVRPTRLGFASENVLVATLKLDESRYDRRRSHQFYEQITERVAGLPGVQSVSLYDGMPGGFMNRSRGSTEIEGYTPGPNEDMQIDVSTVGPGYFTNMKMPFVHGRDFTARDRDNAPCVVIINEVFARRYFTAGVSPIGRHLARRYRTATGNREMCEIVGVIRDNAFQALNKELRPFWALPVLQTERDRMTLLVGSSGDPTALTPAVRQLIRELDPSMPVADVQSLNQQFSANLYPFRLLGIVVGGCGLLALLLAAVGIYGVVSYSVAQRNREMGLRLALGAMRTDVLKMIIGQGMAPVAYGLGLGLLLGYALTRVLTSLPLGTEVLFGVSATDTITFAAVTLFLGTIAAIACYVPARRATRVDPIVTLRGI